MTPVRPRVAVSACVLGEPVRWDGRDKREPLVAGPLAAHLELLPVCPEVGVGMGVPREPVQLVAGPGGRTLLRGVQSGRDWTDALEGWTAAQVAALLGQDVAGVVLKSRSPSCGPAGVPVFAPPPAQVAPAREGAGLFAAAVARAGLPFVDEVALRDAAARDAFLARVFARARLATEEPRAFLAHHRRLLRWLGGPRCVKRLEACAEDAATFRALTARALAGDGAPSLVRPLAAALRALHAGAAGQGPRWIGPADLATGRAALRALAARRVGPDVPRACLRRAARARGADVDALLAPYPEALEVTTPG